MKRLLGVLLAAGFALTNPGAFAFADPGDPPASIYHLDAALTDQDGIGRGLDAHRGHTVLITMFYSGCQATCPMIIDTLRTTERAVPEARRKNLRVLLISIDPERDTPAALGELARSRHIDTSRWTLLNADAGAVRKIAALLKVQYRQMPGGEFSHSNVISVLSPHGEILASTTALGRADPAVVAALGK